MSSIPIIEKLLLSEEPSIRWRTRVGVLGESRDNLDIKNLEEEIKNSARVKALLKNGTADFKNVYDKWQGCHWILISLSDIGYPRNDAALMQSANKVSSYWLSERFFNEYEVERKENAYTI